MAGRANGGPGISGRFVPVRVVMVLTILSPWGLDQRRISMQNRLRPITMTCVLLGTAFGLAACQNDRGASTRRSDSDNVSGTRAGNTTLTGTLRSGAPAVGGE